MAAAFDCDPEESLEAAVAFCTIPVGNAAADDCCPCNNWLTNAPKRKQVIGSRIRNQTNALSVLEYTIFVNIFMELNEIFVLSFTSRVGWCQYLTTQLLVSLLHHPQSVFF